MSESDIQADVRGLIADHIESVMALEVLLLLYREPHREFSAEDVARTFRIERPWTELCLAALVRAGLLCQTGHTAVCYRYYPDSIQTNARIAALARAYAERPLGVICFIHSKPSRTIHTFTDAFRIRGADDPRQ